MSEPASRVVLLASDGPSTRIVYHALHERYPDLVVILEEPVSRARLLQRRLRTLGALATFGQALFVATVAPALRRAGRARIEEIKRLHGLDDAPIERTVRRVPSANSEEARAVLRELAPRVVVVNGTRIIGRDTLGCTPAIFLNTHAGITPLYRGVHGGYWALAEGRAELVGSTVHLVDPGIDTGAIVEQATFQVTERDSFATYPYLHVAAGLAPLQRAVEAALQGGLSPRAEERGLASRLRHHPTLWGYLGRRLLRGVR